MHPSSHLQCTHVKPPLDRYRDVELTLFLLLVVLAAVLPQVETVEDTLSTTLLKEPLWPAIPLQSPYQTTTQRSLPSADDAPFSEDQTIQKSENVCYEVKLLIQH